MLALSPRIGYIDEPFHRVSGIEGINRWFLYVREGMKDELKYYNLIQAIFQGRAIYKRSPAIGNRITLVKKFLLLIIKNRKNLESWYTRHNPLVNRYLIKDPIACMSSEYLHRVFNMEVLVVVRHPAAFVGSLKRLNWRFDFREFLDQKELMHDHLAEILKDCKLENMSIAKEGALLWKCIYKVLFCYLKRNSKMIGIRHEDLSLNPIDEFKSLYEKLGIQYTPKIERKIRLFTQSSNPVDPINNMVHSLRRNSNKNINRWKNLLSTNEVETIYKITSDLAKQYYADNEW